AADAQPSRPRPHPEVDDEERAAGEIDIVIRRVQQVPKRLLRLLADEAAEGRVWPEAVSHEDLRRELRLPVVAERVQIGAEFMGHADDGFGIVAPDRADGDGHRALAKTGRGDARRYRPREDARRQPRCSAGWWRGRNGRAAPGWHASRRPRRGDASQMNAAAHAASPSPANRAASAASASRAAPGAARGACPWR